MCYGIILNNGRYCPHEIRTGENAGDCSKRRNDYCHQNHEWCDICETWYADGKKCECCLDER